MRRRWLWVAIVGLVVLHHDFWWWEDRTLLLGFLPLGLAYHMGYSVAAALLWVVAIRFAWPGELEEWAQGGGAAPDEASAAEPE